MKNGLTITFKNTEHTPHLEEFIENRFLRLKRFNRDLLHCKVTVSTPNKRRKHGNPTRVVVTASLPGRNVVIRRQTDPNADTDLYTVLSDAFRVAETQVKDKRERRFPLDALRKAVRQTHPQLTAT